MQVIKRFSINTEVAGDKDEMLGYPLVLAHFVPETDNRFMLEFDGFHFIHLRTIETGTRQKLI